MMQELFTIGENQMVQLNKVWISLVPAFRALLARDKGGPNDGSGKYKKKAIREFTYMYHMLSYQSPLENRSPEERHELSMAYAGLEQDDVDKLRDINKDPEYVLAWETYDDFILNSSSNLQTLRDMKAAKHSMNAFLRTVDFTRTTDNGSLKYDVGKIQNNIMNMPKLEAAIDEMERKVRDDINGTFEMRGGAEKGEEEDPDDE